MAPTTVQLRRGITFTFPIVLNKHYTNAEPSNVQSLVLSGPTLRAHSLADFRRRANYHFLRLALQRQPLLLQAVQDKGLSIVQLQLLWPGEMQMPQIPRLVLLHVLLEGFELSDRCRIAGGTPGVPPLPIVLSQLL